MVGGGDKFISASVFLRSLALGEYSYTTISNFKKPIKISPAGDSPLKKRRQDYSSKHRPQLPWHSPPPWDSLYQNPTRAQGRSDDLGRCWLGSGFRGGRLGRRWGMRVLGIPWGWFWGGRVWVWSVGKIEIVWIGVGRLCQPGLGKLRWVLQRHLVV